MAEMFAEAELQDSRPEEEKLGCMDGIRSGTTDR